MPMFSLSTPPISVYSCLRSAWTLCDESMSRAWLSPCTIPQDTSASRESITRWSPPHSCLCTECPRGGNYSYIVSLFKKIWFQNIHVYVSLCVYFETDCLLSFGFMYIYSASLLDSALSCSPLFLLKLNENELWMFYSIVLFTISITLVNMYLIHNYFMWFRLFYNIIKKVPSIAMTIWIQMAMNYAPFNICVD